MKVVIRLSRVGKKKQPSYRIVVVPSSAPRDGKSLETVGHHGASFPGQPLLVNLERYDHWIGQGAQPSKRVKRIVSKYRRSGATGTLLQEEGLLSKPPADKAVSQAEESAAEPVAEKAVEETPSQVDEEPVPEGVSAEVMEGGGDGEKTSENEGEETASGDADPGGERASEEGDAASAEQGPTEPSGEGDPGGEASPAASPEGDETPEDAPEDAPDDVPEDVPEDAPEDAPEEEMGKSSEKEEDK